MAGPLGKLLLITVAAGLVSGCSVRDQLAASGNSTRIVMPFNARLSTDDTQRSFTVTVDAEGASLVDVRESARYPATRHCIDRTGSSEVDWLLDPATGDWQVQRVENGDLIVQGRCRSR